MSRVYHLLLAAKQLKFNFGRRIQLFQELKQVGRIILTDYHGMINISLSLNKFNIKIILLNLIVYIFLLKI